MKACKICKKDFEPRPNIKKQITCGSIPCIEHLNRLRTKKYYLDNIEARRAYGRNRYAMKKDEIKEKQNQFRRKFKKGKNK